MADTEFVPTLSPRVLSLGGSISATFKLWRTSTAGYADLTGKTVTVRIDDEAGTQVLDDTAATVATTAATVGFTAPAASAVVGKRCTLLVTVSGGFPSFALDVYFAAEAWGPSFGPERVVRGYPDLLTTAPYGATTWADHFADAIDEGWGCSSSWTATC